MSKHNKHDFRNQPKKETNVNPEETNVNPEETNVNPEETNVNPEETNVNPEETNVNPEETNVKLKNGHVINCGFLNVRNNPTPDSKIVEKIPNGRTVRISEKESTDKYYSITVFIQGIEYHGYCLKEYIEVND